MEPGTQDPEKARCARSTGPIHTAASAAPYDRHIGVPVASCGSKHQDVCISEHSGRAEKLLPGPTSSNTSSLSMGLGSLSCGQLASDTAPAGIAPACLTHLAASGGVGSAPSGVLATATAGMLGPADMDLHTAMPLCKQAMADQLGAQRQQQQQVPGQQRHQQRLYYEHKLQQQHSRLQHCSSLQQPLLDSSAEGEDEDNGADAGCGPDSISAASGYHTSHSVCTAPTNTSTCTSSHSSSATLTSAAAGGPPNNPQSTAAQQEGPCKQQGERAADQPASPCGQDAGNTKAVVFGLINGAVGLPSLIAYAAIVFKAPAYAPYLDTLCRFFFLSSAVHQLVFVLLSTIPSAIGQVQDVGLIFLSAMASAVALQCGDAGLGPHVTLGTALLTCTLSTLITGALMILVGKLRLAQLVQYVPLPVVGGYLGYVGYFCIAGGIALGCSTQIDTLLSWRNLLTLDALIKLVPTLGSLAALMFTLAHCDHPLALPGVLLAIPLAFHAVLWGSGWTLEDAQQAGWVIPPAVGDGYFWQLWRLFNLGEGLNGVYWPALLAQAPKLVGLFLVVCFGACMDVAAIQQDSPQPLDFNKELGTVGIANCVVGAMGVGYTGSYIFSQTVFTMRARVFNRWNGLVVAAMELLVFALPFSVVQYCPNFFFGALLLWFGVEISRDWLVLSARKTSVSEYLLLWLTFAAIMAFDLELGILLGCLAATLHFAYSYARSQVGAVQQLATAKGGMQSTSSCSCCAQRVQQLVQDSVVCVALSGYVFFGSSPSISAKVEQICDDMVARVTGGRSHAAGQKQEACHTGLHNQTADAKQMCHRSSTTHAAHMDGPLFAILDMRGISHMDATGGRTFSSLVNNLASKHIHVLFTGLGRPTTTTANTSTTVESSSPLRSLLTAHGINVQAAPAGPPLLQLGTVEAGAVRAIPAAAAAQQQQQGASVCVHLAGTAESDCSRHHNTTATDTAIMVVDKTTEGQFPTETGDRNTLQWAKETAGVDAVAVVVDSAIHAAAGDRFHQQHMLGDCVGTAAGSTGICDASGGHSAASFKPPSAGMCYEFATVEAAMQYVHGCYMQLTV